MSKLCLSTIALTAILLFAAFLQLPTIPALAQSGDVGNAQATITAATAQAQDAQWQRQQAATRAALDLQSQAQATRTALDAQADDAAARLGATATAEAISAEATSQAHQGALAATAQAQAYSAQAAATIEAGAAQATVTAWGASRAEDARRAEMGGTLLFLVGAVCVTVLGVLLVRWAMMIKFIRRTPVEIVDNADIHLLDMIRQDDTAQGLPPVVASGRAAQMWERGE